MERGKISDYTQIDLVDRIRRAHAQRHIVLTASSQNRNIRKSKMHKSMPCTFYNLGFYNYATTYKTKRVLYKHICSFCFSKGEKIWHMLKLIVEAKVWPFQEVHNYQAYLVSQK